MSIKLLLLRYKMDFLIFFYCYYYNLFEISLTQQVPPDMFTCVSRAFGEKQRTEVCSTCLDGSDVGHAHAGRHGSLSAARK